MILRAKVKQVFKISRSSAGSRTIKTKLNEQGIQIGRFKVSHLMAEIGLICKQPGPHAYKQATVERLIFPMCSIGSSMLITPIKSGVEISAISGVGLTGLIWLLYWIYLHAGLLAGHYQIVPIRI